MRPQLFAKLLEAAIQHPEALCSVATPHESPDCQQHLTVAQLYCQVSDTDIICSSSTRSLGTLTPTLPLACRTEKLLCYTLPTSSLVVQAFAFSQQLSSVSQAGKRVC